MLPILWFTAQVYGFTNVRGLLHMLPLKSMHTFSSISADVGNAGQSNYAAANAALTAITQASAQQVRVYNQMLNHICMHNMGFMSQLIEIGIIIASRLTQTCSAGSHWKRNWVGSLGGCRNGCGRLGFYESPPSSRWKRYTDLKA